MWISRLHKNIQKAVIKFLKKSYQEGFAYMQNSRCFLIMKKRIGNTKIVTTCFFYAYDKIIIDFLLQKSLTLILVNCNPINKKNAITNCKYPVCLVFEFYYKLNIFLSN